MENRTVIVGYARVSSPEQSLAPQFDALEQAGCERIYSDIASSCETDRPGLTEALEVLRPRDMLVVWKLDRMGRSLNHLVELIGHLQEQRIELLSLAERLDTTARNGNAVYRVFGVLAEFEADLQRARSQDGVRAARSPIRKGGRPRVLDEKKLALARRWYKEGERLPKDICYELGISKATLYRYVSPNKGSRRVTKRPSSKTRGRSKRSPGPSPGSRKGSAGKAGRTTGKAGKSKARGADPLPKQATVTVLAGRSERGSTPDTVTVTLNAGSTPIETMTIEKGPRERAARESSSVTSARRTKRRNNH